MRLSFYATNFGDAMLINLEDGKHLFLVDCGYGLDYQQIIRSSTPNLIQGLVLTHAHLDHWAALDKVLPLLDRSAWIAKSGTTFSPAIMVRQRPYYKAKVESSFLSVIGLYQALSSSLLLRKQIGDVCLYDLNEQNSQRSVVVQSADTTQDHSLIHRGCIVPVIQKGVHTIVLGADLEAPLWRELYLQGLLPQNVDVLQAPNHGQKQGRIEKEILTYLNPRFVIISDADPSANDNVESYQSLGCTVFSLKGVQKIVVHVAETLCVEVVSSGEKYLDST